MKPKVLFFLSATFLLLLGSASVGFAQFPPPPVSFSPAVNYPAGSLTIWVTVGDFNGDGKPDLAVAGLYSGVSVLLGNGDGTFQAAVNYLAGSNSRSIAVGDFNGDGKLDLAVANPGSSNVSVLLGNGDGTFQAPLNYTVGTPGTSGPVAVTVGDFNGDGKLDLAVAGRDIGVNVLLGNGDGTFQAPVSYTVGTFPMSVAVGDFNGDGKLDLAVANNESNNVSVLLGKGDGTFQPAVNYAVGTFPVSVTVGDFNGDGKLDLAVANTASSNVSVLLGNGDGTFQAAVNYAADNPWSITVGDFNGDGKPDLAVASADSNNVSVLLGKGDGTFQPAVTFAVGTYPQSIAMGDFNGDGKPDLATANYTTNNVSVLLNVPPQPLNPAPDQPTELKYDFGPYNYVVDYFGDPAYSGYSLRVTPLLTTQAQFATRVKDTSYAGTTCSIFNGTGGNCVIFELTCEENGTTVPCPTPSNYNTAYNIFTINWDTPDNLNLYTNPGFLKADIGLSNWENTLTFFYPQRQDQPDPTGGGRTRPGYSDFVFVYNLPTGTPPTITITTPVDGAVYALGENVLAEYSCSGSVASCVGNVTSTYPIDTSSTGSKTFVVNAVASSGPSAVKTVSYQVSSTLFTPNVSLTGAPATAAYQSSFTVTATTNASTWASITAGAGGACSVTGIPVDTTSSTGTVTTATVTMTNSTGTCILTANWAADANYAAASATQSTLASGPLAGVSPSTGINFGTVYLGTITTKNVTVTNQGTAPMTITDPLLSIVSGGKWFVAVNLCPKSLAAGKSCTISVSFVAGPFYTPQTATLKVMDNAPGSPQTVTLSATVINPQAHLSAPSLSFGTQKVNTSSSAAKAVTLTNTGTTSLTLSTLSIAGDFSFATGTTCTSGEVLAAGARCLISVNFTPTAKGARLGSVTIKDNALLGEQIIVLSGTGN
jgi:hypothetical protein